LRVRPRDVDLPLHIRATTDTGLRTLTRTVRRAFDPRRGDGRLRVTTVDGLTRDLTCRYVGGWLGDESQATYGMTWQTCLLTLRALDPYWYASSPTVALFAIEGTSTFFPLLPLELNVSSLTGENVVSNPGDVDAWPVWTLTGPASTITLENLTADPETSLELDTSAVTGDTLDTAEQLTIDTRPGYKSVVGPGALNYYGTLAPGAQLWPLLAGTQTIRITITGATTATTLQLSFTPRYLGL
jgi:hypothetical protein